MAAVKRYVCLVLLFLCLCPTIIFAEGFFPNAFGNQTTNTTTANNTTNQSNNQTNVSSQLQRQGNQSSDVVNKFFDRSQYKDFIIQDDLKLFDEEYLQPSNSR